MSKYMNSKFVVTSVLRNIEVDSVSMLPVTRSSEFPDDEAHEDNIQAKLNPFGEIKIGVTDPKLRGQIEPGTVVLVDFTFA